MAVLICDIVALVLFILASIGAPVPRVNLVAAGLAFLTVAMMISGGVLHG